METYFDTSLLLAAYLPEPGTAAVLEILRAINPPVPFSHLLELEMRTAIRLKYGRGEINAEAMRGALRSIEGDLAKGILARPAYGLESVFERAEGLSAKHAAATLTRTADLWHVAAALQCGCRAFASLDERQRQVARLCRLEVIPASVPAPKTRKAKP